MQDDVSCNVKVVVRVRPLVARERLAGARECLDIVGEASTIVVGPDKAYRFDAVAGPEVGQAQLFQDTVVPLLDAFGEQGHNATILAYGQTGSGKTFTMGTGIDFNDGNVDGGIVPRAIEYLFQRYLHHQQHNDNEGEGSWDLLVSFLEIYNEEIIDLLNPSVTTTTTRRPLLTIREGVRGEIFIAGIREEPVKSLAQVMDVLGRGSLCRTTKSTDMNMLSSRSHAIFTLMLRRQKGAVNLISKLHFVDLAGSERLKRTNVLGARVKESISINSGLLALGNVISALSQTNLGSVHHVPYRDSKLTRLLQDALGGNSRTLMIACVSPSSDNYGETVNTLKYAHRTRNIRNTISLNQDSVGSGTFEIMQLRKQIQSLKQQLLMARTSKISEETAGGQKKTATNNNTLQRRLEQLIREKAAVEAERDHYKALFQQKNGNIESINTAQAMAHLKARIAELESLMRQDSHKTSPLKIACPATPEPAWMNRTNILIEKTRLELQNSLRLAQNEDEDDEDEDISKSNGQLPEPQLTQELLDQLCTSQQEYLAMKGRYEERLRLLQENLTTVQRERDSLITTETIASKRMLAGRRGFTISSPPSSSISSSASSAAISRTARAKYEERIKQLGRELNDLKAKLADLGRTAGSRGAANDQLIRNLRASLQTLKLDRDRLAERLEQETGSLRSNQQGLHVELCSLRQREYKASEGLKRWRRACELQKALLQKKAEQYQYLRGRIRLLLGALRRQRISASVSSPLINLDSPSWQRILSGTNSGSGCATPQVPSRLGSHSVHNSDTDNDEEEEPGPLLSIADTDVVMSSPSVSATAAVNRRPSLDPQPPTSPGQTLPRSVLRMSPLLPRRGDFLARIAAVTSRGGTADK